MRHWFLDHPDSIGESYASHQRIALAYGASLFVASLACFIHALVPCLFERTASRTITRLHASMRARPNPQIMLPSPAADAGLTPSR